MGYAIAIYITNHRSEAPALNWFYFGGTLLQHLGSNCSATWAICLLTVHISYGNS